MVDDAGASSSEVVDELLGTYSNEERQQGHGEGRGTPSGERFRRENHLGQGGGLRLATRGRIAQKPESPEAVDFTQQGRRRTPCDESSPSLNLCRYVGTREGIRALHLPRAIYVGKCLSSPLTPLPTRNHIFWCPRRRNSIYQYLPLLLHAEMESALCHGNPTAPEEAEAAKFTPLPLYSPKTNPPRSHRQCSRPCPRTIW